MNRQHLLPLIFLLVSIGLAHGQHASAGAKPLVYTAFSSDEKPELKRAACKAYAAKYQVIEVPPAAGFSPGGMKGLYTSTYRLRGPRSMRDYAIPGRITYAWIVTSYGAVAEPHILQSTDDAVTKYVLNKITSARYFPAKLHGAPVASLHVEEWTFGSDERTEHSSDGLGVYHSRDR